MIFFPIFILLYHVLVSLSPVSQCMQIKKEGQKYGEKDTYPFSNLSKALDVPMRLVEFRIEDRDYKVYIPRLTASEMLSSALYLHQIAFKGMGGSDTKKGRAWKRYS